jgi:hypothetical protein
MALPLDDVDVFALLEGAEPALWGALAELESSGGMVSDDWASSAAASDDSWPPPAEPETQLRCIDAAHAAGCARCAPAYSGATLLC